VATNYSVDVQATGSGYPNASYTLRLRQMPITTLNFDAQFNTNGFSNAGSGSLISGQSSYYQVTVPSVFKGQPVLGWKLVLNQSSGSASLRISKSSLPQDYAAGTSAFVSGEMIVAPPFLTPGIWLVEVRGSG